jgi:hypothetical protein
MSVLNPTSNHNLMDIFAVWQKVHAFRFQAVCPSSPARKSQRRAVALGSTPGPQKRLRSTSPRAGKQVIVEIRMSVKSTAC